MRLVRRRVRLPRERARRRHFRNPFYSALSLIGNLASLAILYLLLSGEFVAAGQVLVYGGAVMVMFLFVIAYLGDRSEESPWSGGPSWQILGAVAAGGAMLAEVIVVVGLKRAASSAAAARSTAASARRQRSAGCSSPTTCSHSR